jgi:hypothetical protein
MQKRYKWLIFIFFISVFFLLMLRITLPYFSFNYDVGFLLTKQAILHINAWRISFYIHITSSLFVLLFGAFQFSTNLLKYKPKFHRTCGIIYVFTILILSAPSGFIMGIYANGDWMAKTSFVTTAALWWLFTFYAFRDALNKKFNRHRANMYRSYALTLSAITLRTLVVLMPTLGLHLAAKNSYALVAWLSWIPNLIAAEILLRKIQNNPVTNNIL